MRRACRARPSLARRTPPFLHPPPSPAPNPRARSYKSGNLASQSYLPFKVNATGVMPLIFASSLLALPSALARYTDTAALDDAARALGPGGALYTPFNIALIIFFNYYYTFLQARGGAGGGGDVLSGGGAGG